MKILNTFFILTILILNSCAYPEEFQQVNHANEFYIEIPSYMEACDDLTDDAEIQYKNAYRNTYCIIKSEVKNEKTFAEFQEQALDVIENYELLTSTLITDSAFRENETFNAIDIQLYTVMTDENVYYWHSSFETKDKFFEVVCWTRTSDRQQRYGPDLMKIIQSFRPLL